MGRVLPGIGMALSWVLLLYFAPALLFWAILLLIGTVAVSEYLGMTGTSMTSGCQAMQGGAMLLPLVGGFTGVIEGMVGGATVALLVLLLLTFFTYRRQAGQALDALCRAGFGLLWIGMGWASLMLIWYLPQGNLWLLLLTAITAGSDTGAYYTGRFLGRSKLCPSISPGKTVAGVVGGLVAGTFAAIMVLLLLLPHASLSRLLLGAPLLVIVGVMGDLAESIVKRECGVKDSGRLLAGHGGVLDRIDSLLLTAPVLYYLLRFGMLL